MKIGSLFSGIGGLELGLERATGGRTIWQVERDEWCRRVLAKHWPEAVRFDDVRTVGADVLTPVDLLCGGFPCQDVSAAGRGAGLAGARSGLWYEFRRIVGELRPRAVVVENVASGARRWVPHVLGDLAGMGYRARAYALSAADVGAPHLRRRVFIVAYPDRSVANRDRDRCEGQRGSGVLDGERPALGDDAHRRDGAHAWPPRRGDDDGWREWLAAGHPPAAVPRLRRGPDGVPGGLDRDRRARLKALGNAVVPQCAEVIGRIVMSLETMACEHADGGVWVREQSTMEAT